MATALMSPPGTPTRRVVVCGSGLAAAMTAAVLSRQLPSAISIDLVRTGRVPESDIFYGHWTTPAAYRFHLEAGLTEPALLGTDRASFALGTQYESWGSRSWVQAYHLPLPVIEGVAFHQYLTMMGETELSPVLVSAVAAAEGAFAHPPHTADHPLARAEYGYQLDLTAYAAIFEQAIDRSRVRMTDGTISEIHTEQDRITGIRLSGGRVIEGDLFVDCTGPDAVLLATLGGRMDQTDHVFGALRHAPAEGLGPACPQVAADDAGWRSISFLPGSTVRLAVGDPAAEEALGALVGGDPDVTGEVPIGMQREAWRGNCVAIGHAAGVVEPLTPAPLLLLQRDVSRLLSLIPVTEGMSVERQEYNRLCQADYSYAGQFARALQTASGLPDTPFWRNRKNVPLDTGLARKLEQFDSRGSIVMYDLEPFTTEDWTILLFGTGRCPERYDRLADRAPRARVEKHLDGMRRDIARLVSTMPSHEKYMAGLIRYLEKNKVV